MLNRSGSSFDKMFDITKDFRYKLKEENGSYKFSYVSDSFTAITGISTEDAESMTLKELVHDEDQQKLSNHLKTILSGKPNTEQFRIRGEGGKFISVIDYAKPVWDDNRENVEEIKGSISTEISSAKTVTKN